MQDPDHDGKSQLWKTTLHSLCQYTKFQKDITGCICCCKPVLKQDHATRKMDMRAVFQVLLQDPSAQTKSRIYQTQYAHMAAGRDTYVCYICEPMCKRALRQHETGVTITHPSCFLSRSLAYVEGTATNVDKLSLIKAYLCLMAEVTYDDGCVYHPVRSKHFEVMEGVVVFMRRIFEVFECNVRDFSRDKRLCPFIVTNTVKWHFSGCPFVFDDMKSSSRVRKLFKGPLNKIYGKLFHNDPEFDVLVMYRDGLLTHNVPCAACEKDQVELVPQEPAYDQFFLTPPDIINARMGHANERHCDLSGCSLVCLHRKGVSLRAFAYYQRFSQDFPDVFRENNKHRYYHDRMSAPGTVSGCSSTISHDEKMDG